MPDIHCLKNQRGFTIIEVIVVLSIITVGLIGVTSLVVQTVQVEHINKNVLIASQLAQEGLELARNIRDTNWIAGTSPWFSPFADAPFKIGYNSNPVQVASANEALLLIDNTGHYNHLSGRASIFSRLITISNLGTASSTVSCRVSWSEKGRAHNYVAESVLYDWKGN